MKIVNYFTAMVLCVLTISCSKDTNEDTATSLQTANSQICANIQGASAIYWDFSNGLPTSMTQAPLLKNPGQQFVHSQLPLLGFTMPQGFSAFEVTDPLTATLGVNVVRNDNSVVYRWVPNTRIFGTVSTTSIIANEINMMFAHYGFNGTPEVLCTTTSNTTFEGIPMAFTARLLRFGNITGQVWVRSTYIAESTFSTISVTAAPTGEFDNQVFDTFLPINFQLYVGSGGSAEDKDGDGFSVLEDPDDNDRNVPINRG
ncbi:MAG: hypothetical protein WBM83_12760 [Flavobacteriaceae bacterium]